MLAEEELTADSLLKAVRYVYDERHSYKKALSESTLNNSIEIIMDLIQSCTK